MMQAGILKLTWEEIKSEGANYYFFHLILRSYDYNMHVEGLLPANLWLD